MSTDLDSELNNVNQSSKDCHVTVYSVCQLSFRLLQLNLGVCVLQLRSSLGDEAKESLEAFQPKEYKCIGESLPESTEWGDQQGLGQTRHWLGGQRVKLS